MSTTTAIPRAAAVLVLVIGLGHFARAQPTGPAGTATGDGANASEAARLYDEGKRHFDIGEYTQAIASWKRSYLRSSAPLLLFNIAQAYRLSNNCAQANRFYLNYRRAENHPKNEAELDKAMAKCAGVEPATGDAATSGPPISPEAPTPGLTTAPPPTPSGQAASSPTSSSAALATTRTPDRGGGWRTAGLVTGGVSAGMLVASGVYAIMARQDSSTVSRARAGTPYTGDIASTDRSGRTAASRAQILVGVGAVLAIAGGAAWYFGHRQGNAQIDVAVVPGRTEVVFSCAF